MFIRREIIHGFMKIVTVLIGLNTLTEAKEHFQKINWTNGIKVPFNITTFKFIRGDVV